MVDYQPTTEIVRFAFVFGVVVSMLLYERRHITTGSIVVPGYIAISILNPFVIVATAFNALASYAIVNRLISRKFLLYGRTKFTVLALVSILIQATMLKLTPSGDWLWDSDVKLFVGVGYVVPALIAHDMGRQGIAKTIKSVALAAVIVATPIALALRFDLPGVHSLAPLQGSGDTAIDAAWIAFAVLLSTTAAWGVALNYGYRSGGFVGAAFIGVLIGDPWQVLIAALVACVTYIVVTKLLMNSMILFGRRKFSAMLLVSSSLSWGLLWIGSEVFGTGVQQHLDLGSLALTPLFIPALLANDAQRTSPGRVVLGVCIATTFVLTTTWWVQSVFTGVGLATGWKAISIGSFGAIFWRQFAHAAEKNPAPIPGRTVLRPKLNPPTGAPDLAVFGRKSYHRWASQHPHAAADAERWLAIVLGEPEPARLVIAGRPATVALSVSMTLSRERSAERIREAAVRELADQQVRRRGEFDAVSADIAEHVGRPTGRAQRRTTGEQPERQFIKTALQAARVSLAGQTKKISGSPGADTRAHLTAPGARNNKVPGDPLV